MRVVIQRASEASVTIGGQVRGSIGLGLVVLLGIEDADTAADIVAAQGKQLLAFAELNSKQESTERVLKWVLAVVTSVGVGTAVVVLSQTLTPGHQ